MIKGLLISVLLCSASPLLADTVEDIKLNEVACLAKNIYFEARNQSVEGRIAVAQVTINRKNDDRFPNSICGVVKQARRTSEGDLVRNKCQFSWYCDGKSDIMKEEMEAREAFLLASLILNGIYSDNTKGATHYHATSVSPYWRNKLTKVVAIEDHIFYK